MNPALDKMHFLFHPRSVAVLGATERFGTWGFGVISRMLRGGDFKVYPVNPKGGEILGAKAYPKVTDIPGDVDLAVIVVPPEHVPTVMNDCAAKGVKAAVIITAGFREVGEDGAKLEAEVVRIARQAGIRFVGPNGNGHFHAQAGLFSMGGVRVKAGPISLVSQSGNFGGHIVSQGSERGIGFSKYVSSGNEADLTIEDYIEYLGQDEATKVICAYVEGLKDGRRFLEVAREVTRVKPIVIMKVGRSAEGAGAAMSHTGSLSGSDRVNRAVLRHAGVIRVGRVDEMLDVASALIRQPLPKGRRVGIVTGGGGFGVVATDACRGLGLEIPPLKPETIERLSRYMPGRWSHANPVDMAGDSNKSLGCCGTMLKADEIDAVLAVSCLGYTGASPDNLPEDIRDKVMAYDQMMLDGEKEAMSGLIERIERFKKPFIIAAVASVKRSPAMAELARNDIYTYATPEDGARALAYLADYSDYLARFRDGAS